VANALEAGCDAPAGTLDVLDAGCGTGLCGPLVRAHARTLTGVDLSARMLEKARQRGVYDQLHKAELTHYLTQHRERWDVVLSADTLCYFGDLDAVLAASHGALRPGGRLIFTVEALQGEQGVPFHLHPNGRYAHRHGYVGAAMARAGFDEIRIDGQVLRNECGEPVRGWLVSGRRPQPR
jgi:predicted TPR repeat methyltransferase